MTTEQIKYTLLYEDVTDRAVLLNALIEYFKALKEEVLSGMDSKQYDSTALCYINGRCLMLGRLINEVQALQESYKNRTKEDIGQ